ncbi:helix-turn-helix domain-containing protein [Peptostreptococcus faecalis]|uniref:helix-turn-helix domain-containing protein n=1 Tax=Peptostreptococcus faecalis TaxID=2045015 RepID=UPI000C7B06B3|nr:helix-turn-helix transcriptional regulator [Peptostreptococcus faecalis]
MNPNEQIKFKRKELNLSQEELAEKLFVSRQTVSNWENGRSFPDVQNLIALSILYGISLDELVKGDLKEMKKSISDSEINKYIKIMIIFMLLAMISVGPSIYYLEGYWSFIPMGFLWAIAFYASRKVEKLKTLNNIDEYKELIALLENKSVGEINSENNKLKLYSYKILTPILVSLIFALMAIGSYGAMKIFFKP